MACMHPGKVLLQQYLAPLKLSQNKLARAIKVPPRRINEIVHAKRAVTADTATRLAIYFGGSATYWMHLQAEYDIEKVRKTITIQLSTIPSPLHATPELIDGGKKLPHPTPTNNIKNRIMR